jgi:hypothetical protein
MHGGLIHIQNIGCRDVFQGLPEIFMEVLQPVHCQRHFPQRLFRRFSCSDFFLPPSNEGPQPNLKIQEMENEHVRIIWYGMSRSVNKLYKKCIRNSVSKNYRALESKSERWQFFTDPPRAVILPNSDIPSIRVQPMLDDVFHLSMNRCKPHVAQLQNPLPKKKQHIHIQINSET